MGQRNKEDSSMKKMSANNVMAIYLLLKNNEACRLNNYLTIQQFYKKEYGIEMPDLPSYCPNINTVDRVIRQLKSVHHELRGNKETQLIKKLLEGEYKDMNTDKNKLEFDPNVTVEELGFEKDSENEKYIIYTNLKHPGAKILIEKAIRHGSAFGYPNTPIVRTAIKNKINEVL